MSWVTKMVLTCDMCGKRIKEKPDENGEQEKYWEAYLGDGKYIHYHEECANQMSAGDVLAALKAELQNA